MKDIPLDKQAHFWAGLAILLSSALFVSLIVSAIVVIIAAKGKEIYDKYHGGTEDNNDMVATLLGGFVGSTLILIRSLA